MTPHMPRDPETGQFQSMDEAAFDDVEVATFEAYVGVQASDLTGGTGFNGGDDAVFEGVELIDYDDLVDRNEELHLLEAQHAINVYANSTETADGTVRAAVEISASPSRTVAALGPSSAIADSTGGARSASVGTDDSIDLIGRYLQAIGQAPFSDSTTGVGGGGSAGEDRVTVEAPPGPVARFHPRDELFLNGAFDAWNIDDAGIHVDVYGQHVYGVVED